MGEKTKTTRSGKGPYPHHFLLSGGEREGLMEVQGAISSYLNEKCGEEMVKRDTGVTWTKKTKRKRKKTLMGQEKEKYSHERQLPLVRSPSRGKTGS